jgi:adenylosuccinate lyase
VGARLGDHRAFAHLWGTEELRALFDEDATLQRWLDVLSALADTQAELNIIPADAARSIASHVRVELLDLDRIAEGTRTTGHSTLGLIRELQRVLPDDAHPWVYYGATVQDITDTATAIALREVARIVRRDLLAIEDTCLQFAENHRATVMVGRTHGQPGSPVTFGWKAASWADEIGRHLQRIGEGVPRCTAGQLGGAVGTLGFFGQVGPQLRTAFCQRLGLVDPATSWLSARDRIAEFGTLLALVTGTLGRIGNEVYQLQREELGELREAVAPDTVSSITMPHKRNPEVSEHLVTLSRIVRANAGVLMEGMVSEHERDARAWKAEWVVVPEMCLLAGTATHLCAVMLDGLEIDTAAMAEGVAATRGRFASERLLAGLALRIGKHEAQSLLQRLLADGKTADHDLVTTLAEHPELSVHFDAQTREELTAHPDVGAAAAMIDEVLARARGERSRHADPGP